MGHTLAISIWQENQVTVTRFTIDKQIKFSFTVLSLSDLKLLVEKLHAVQPKWYELGLQLEIPPESLDVIKKDNPETSTAFIEMLKQWLAGKEPSLEKLSGALRKKTVCQDRLGLDILDILLATCELPCSQVASFPGSPLHFYFFVGARGEPGNKASSQTDLQHFVCIQ